MVQVRSKRCVARSLACCKHALIFPSSCSFNVGPVHFISLNSETDFPGAGEEHTGDSHLLPAGHFAPDGVYLKWLEADLKAAQAERDVRPWILAGGHRPFPEIQVGGCCSAMLTQLLCPVPCSRAPLLQGNGVAELFEKYQVDMYFAGHTHRY